MSGPDPYLHGTSAEEQERLQLMNGILNGAALRELSLKGDETVLDLGAGTAIFAREMAAALPRGRVLAIERDPEQIAGGRVVGAGVENLELRQGDALDPSLTGEEWESFDVVHARFLLEHMSNPLAAVRCMVRAARPGGRIVLIDDDHSLMRLWPEPAGFDRLWSIYEQQYEAHGFDPYVGRRTVSLLVEAGARPAHTTLIFYGGCSGDRAFAAVVENLAQVFEGVRDRIVATGEIDRATFERSVAELRDWGRRDDAALWYSLPWAEAIRP